MSSIGFRIAFAILIAALLAAPALGYSDGPPDEPGTDMPPTVIAGCTCHGEGAPSDRAVVSMSGVPTVYSNGTEYTFTITVQDSHVMAGESGNTKAGFMLSIGGGGELSWDLDEGIRPAVDSGEEKNANSTSSNISHSKTDNDGVWTIVWTAPSNGDRVDVWLAGNSVNDGGSNDAGDYWNILSFSILPPGVVGNALTGESLQTKTYSVGDYDALFLTEKSPEQLEHERQMALAQQAFDRGNALYWSTLLILILAAVVQREVIERRDGIRPPHLASELGRPQMIRRGILSAILFVIAVQWNADGSGIHLWGSAIVCSAWAAYGVYRTHRAMETPPTHGDLM